MKSFKRVIKIICAECYMASERLMRKLGYKTKTQITLERFKETHPEELNAIVQRMIEMTQKPVSTEIYEEIERVRKTNPKLYHSVMKKIAKKMVENFECKRASDSKNFI